MTDAWYAASLIELKALLDRIGEENVVTLRAEDDAVGAIIAQLAASTVIYAAAQAVFQAKAMLAHLEVS